MTTLQRFCRVVPAMAVASIVLFATSCSNSPGTVKGKITVNGIPIVRGLIVFLPQGPNNDPINVAIIDGAYDSGPMPAGLAKIYITPSTKPPEAGGGGNDLVPRPKGGPAKDTSGIPIKYQSVETSGLTITVKAGETIVFDKDLTP